MSTPPAHAVRRLKDAGRQSVWLIQRPGEQPRTLKSWPLTPLLLVKLALGIAQPQRQLRGARRVARAGIPTAEVCCLKLAWGRPRPAGPRKLRGHGRPQVEIELGWVEGSSAYDLVSSGSLSPSDRRRTSAAVGRVVAKLVEAGLFNRDLKLSNLIVDFSAGRADVWLIDTVGIRRLRRPEPEIARMLERLAVQPARGGIALTPPVWMPAMRHALGGLAAVTRRAVVRRLQAHRQREYA
ncbi:MAG: BUD32 family EKC/KEOPS complex subunit [Planctomycetota bacterium]